MYRNGILSVIVAACLFAIGPAVAEEPLPPSEAWIPADAVLVAKITHVPELIDCIASPEILEAVEASRATEAVKQKKEVRQLLAGVQFLESQLETDWKTAIKELTAGGITLAVLPRGQVILIVDAQDEKLLAKLHETLLFFARMDAENKETPDRVRSAEYRGVTGWSFGPKEAHAILGSRLILSNDPEVLKEVIDLKEGTGTSIDKMERFTAAMAERAGAPAYVYINAELVNAAPQVQKALNNLKEPLPVLLFAGVAESVSQAEWALVTGDLNDNRVTLRFVTGGDGATERKASFAVPSDDAGALPNITVPRRLAAVTLYRDLHDFYATKDELFPERTSGLIFFENMMGIFFSGRNFTEEVLAHATPEVRMVLAAQEYSPEVGEPLIKLPAFATVFRMKDPDQFTPVVEEAWQKALGLINFTRGQQALPGLILDRVEYKGVKYTLSYFSNVDESDKTKLDIRFNFSPTLVRVGDYIVMSSTEGLARDLIDALQTELESGVVPLKHVSSKLEIDGDIVAGLLTANWESLVGRNMLEKGHSRKQAEAEVGMLVAVAELMDHVEVTVADREDRMRATLDVVLDPQAVQKALKLLEKIAGGDAP
ncbi:hypothetical protein JCM19992_20400 [Thermostilla marina]